MHSYLKSVGFSKIKRRSELQELIRDVMEDYDEKTVVANHPDGAFVEYIKYYGSDCGISVCGQYDEDDEFHVEYYFPFLQGSQITTQEHAIIERHIARDSYAGACDDLRVGITLIFYLLNPAKYMIEKYKGEITTDNKPLIFTGLAAEGKILFPLKKEKTDVKVETEMLINKSHLIEAARRGDEAAMESLTIEEMDTYSMISERIATEDILTIVDSYIMPYGIECDQYGVLGDIQTCEIFENSATGEILYKMIIECNNITMEVCINKNDLLGEPAVGRRFKGNIWLQGQYCYY